MNISAGGKRLERLLKMIPFLQANGGIKVEDAAKIFEVTEEQLISDLNLIWLCGLPGYSHLELIDVSFDSGFITITNADTLNQPMSLTIEEGAALLLAIDNLMGIAPDKDLEILRSLREKLLAILTWKDSSKSDSVTNPQQTGAQPVLPKILKAIDNSDHALEINYYSASADEFLRTQVIPINIYNRNAFTYLLAYSIVKNEYVVLRLDRISDVNLIARPKNFHNLPAPQHPGNEIGEEVVIELLPEALWFKEKWGLNTLEFDRGRSAYVGTVKVFNRQWLIRAAMSLEGALRILSPADMRAQVAAAAKSALKGRQ